jgi:F0F1-type ATP synthase assembly protein I
VANEEVKSGGGGKDEADEDEIRARFAGLDAAKPVPHDDLPPVPDVRIERPDTRTARGPEASAAARGDGPGSVLAGMGTRGLRGSSMALTVGTTLVASIGMGVGLGWLADRYLLHSRETPWGLIVGFLVGVVYGFMNLIRVANRINSDAESGGGGAAGK